MSTTKFDKDLTVGQRFEFLVAGALNELEVGHQYRQVEGYFPDYDIKCHSERHRFCPTIECKYDIMSRDYNSFLFEANMLNKSKAAEVYFGDGTECFIFDLAELRRFIRQCIVEPPKNGFYIMQVGDGKKQKAYKLMRWYLLKNVSCRQFPFNVKEIIGYVPKRRTTA